MARHKWLLTLLALFLGCTAITTCGANLPAFAAAAGRGPLFFAAWKLAVDLLLVAAPLAWIGALLMPGPASLAVLRAHAAVYGALLVVTDVVDSAGHSSPAEAFAPLILFVLSLPLGIDAVAAAITWLRLRRSSRAAKALPFVYLGLTAALLGGWSCGVLIWSTLLSHQVIAAAEVAAGDRPYCIDVQERPARSAGDLTGLSMRAANHAGWYYHFHALLVIGDTDRRYMNWSYRTGRFEPVSDSAREGLHLDRIARCAPKIHFARDWR
jgi:hypothetical protein